jgi:hypothetical protein
VIIYSSDGHLQRFRDLFDSESDKESQLNDLENIRLFRGKPFEGIIEGKEIDRLVFVVNIQILDRNPPLVAAMLLSPFFSGLFDEYSPHRLRGGGEKMPSGVPTF